VNDDLKDNLFRLLNSSSKGLAIDLLKFVSACEQHDLTLDSITFTDTHKPTPTTTDFGTVYGITIKVKESS
jgi:hypothetical protein